MKDTSIGSGHWPKKRNTSIGSGHWPKKRNTSIGSGHWPKKEIRALARGIGPIENMYRSNHTGHTPSITNHKLSTE